MPEKIVCLGEILVEIMAEAPGPGFRAPVSLIGPFPSGAPAIFINQVGLLGHPCGIIACVGDDDFGWVNTDRLRRSGVDISAIQVDPERPTGSAFVRYRADGERDFVFNIRHSAAGSVALTDAARALLFSCSHLHVMGSSLSSPAIITAATEALALVKAHGGTVSFDPNIRKEMLGLPGLRPALAAMLRACDIFLPSGSELTLLTQADSEDDAIAEILGLGVGCIVVKHGAAGASYHDARFRLAVPAFAIDEIDPTGAGDCFGATFVTCWKQGRGIEASLRYAAASGALAVAVRGPMEGAASFAQLDAFIAEHER